MSVVMARVWEYSTARRGDLLVLQALADFAHDDGIAWPSVETLARKARLSVRQTQYAIRRLVRSGELKVSKSKGPRGCHLYHIAISESPEGAKIAGVQEMRGAINDNGGALHCTRTVREPS